MIDADTLRLFLVTCVVLVVTPGPDTMYVLARSVEQGRRAGVVSALGICCGFLVHIAAAVVGLSALVMSSAGAFTAVKILGAGYLIFLGVRTLLSRDDDVGMETPATGKTARLFAQGFLTNVLNPKVAVFFLAFIPQFVDPASGSLVAQIVFLGALDMVLCLIWLSLVAWAAGSASALFLRSAAFRCAQRWLTGTILAVLGVRLLFLQRAVPK